jgi:hypothetical protein
MTLTQRKRLLIGGLVIFIAGAVAIGIFMTNRPAPAIETPSVEKLKEEIQEEPTSTEVEKPSRETPNEGISKQREESEEVSPISEIDTLDWKTYRNEERGFEIKHPQDWEIYVGDPERSITFSKETTLGRVGFGIGINLYADEAGVFPGCRFEGEEIIIENNKVHPTIFSSFKDESLEIICKTKEECEQQILGDSHAVTIGLCFGKDLKYLGNYCEEGSGNYYYQFYLHCEGENWQGKEGMEKCNKLFNQIVSSFRFIKNIKK